MEEGEDEIRLGTPTRNIMDEAPLFENEPLSGQDSGASSPEPNDEEAIFTLLFQQCDTDGVGEVEVEQLISYIRKVRLGEQHSDKEEVFDSQEDVPTMQYNLQLLKAMLDCNSSEDGKVDQPTYSHIIRMWVKDVRDRTDRSVAPEPPLEVSRMSDSPDNAEGIGPLQEVSYGSYATGSGNESRESFETSGGLSNSHIEHERIDLINSVADLKLDNKRLQERNKALQIQMENSEENLKDIQTENKELKQQIKDFQASILRLEQVEGDNTELASVVQEGKRQCEQLTANVERLEVEVTNLQDDLKSARSQLNTLELDKNHQAEEGNALRQILLQKEELLSHQEAVRTEMETQLQLKSQKVEELLQNLDELQQSKDELKSQNSDLHTQLRLSRVRGKQPLSSTPYRPSAPSWHEELMEQESLTSTNSPILPRHIGAEGVANGVNGEVELEEEEESLGVSASDSFTKILEETNVKINQKHNLLVREISDLINQPSSSSSRHSVENSRMVIQEKINDRSMHSFETKLADLLRKKKKVEKENSRLAALVEELKKRLSDLENSKLVNGDGQTRLGKEEGVDTGAIEEKAPVQELATQSYRDLDASASFLLPTGSAPPTQLRQRHTLSRSAVAHVDFDGTSSGSTPPHSLVSSSIPVVEKSQQTDPSVVNGNIEELAFQRAYSSALKESTNKEFTDLRERQDELSSQCTQLEKKAEQLRNQKGGWLSFLGGSAYRILKTLTLLLFIVFFIMSIIVFFVVLLDLLSTCGSHCPKSPAYVFYSRLGSYLQYTRTTSPI